jgi:hypothetical protein
MSDTQSLVPYTYSFCRRCDARVELGRVAYGDLVTCRSCGLEFVISRQHSTGDGAGQGATAIVEDPFAPPERKTAWQTADGGSAAGLLFRGTFTFPLRLGTLWQTLTLSAAAAVLVAVYLLGAWCFNSDHDGVDKFTRVLLANGLLFSLAFGAVALPAWIYAASANAMTILRETAWGIDRVESWPNLLALDGVGDTGVMIASLLLAALPGAMAIPLASRLGISNPWAIGVSMALLLPVLLLSMMESGHPLSLTAWKSLLKQWPAWAAFYATTCLVGLACVGIETAVWRRTGWAAEAGVTGAVAVLGGMVYFRLLGRLASFCPVHPRGG